MNSSTRCLFCDSFSNFEQMDSDSIYKKLSYNYHGNELTTTRDAWIAEIEIMKKTLKKYKEQDGQIIFEYNIPRLGKRIDVALLFKGIIFCIEFKVGKEQKSKADIDQVHSYALDLKNFHKYSQDKVIVPILVPTKNKNCSTFDEIKMYDDKVVNPLVTGEDNLSNLIDSVLIRFPDEQPVNSNWINSPYSPTPTIIEAAKILFETNTVENITRHEADKVSIDKTIKYIQDVIDDSKKNKKKSICFVTGVPGAGKTLVGLQIAVKNTNRDSNKQAKDEGAVYLSGNGPLVAVLTEALAQDNYQKYKEKNEKKSIEKSRCEVSKYIQIIHRYRDNMLAKIKNPVENGILEIDPNKAEKMDESGYSEVEHIAIFDEAQRTWTQKRLANYLKRGGTYGNKLKVPNFPLSEAAFLIWSMDQREDWATIVCLVGGGQEINTGEAGISEWINAINEMFSCWEIHISPNLKETEYAEGKVNKLLKNNKKVTYSSDLHLSVDLRSYRAEKLSSFVHALLTFDKENARKLYCEIKDNYPIMLTRDLEIAKRWLRNKARGIERIGVLTTKEAARVKPLPICLLPSGDSNVVNWFLKDNTDTRSSNYLEDAATEIQVQGLELDYTCVLWDADMRYRSNTWEYYKFNYGKTTYWKNILDSEKKKYMLNAYRVLLTRGREGMIICVPKGNTHKNQNGFWEDDTRKPEFYDGTFQYLKDIGIEECK